MPVAFAALAEPHRREILGVLRSGEACVSDLVDHLGLSQPAVSKHLRVLRDAGMVSVRAERQQRFYRLDPGPLRELDQWLEPYRARWSESLDRLDEHLAATRQALPSTPPPTSTEPPTNNPKHPNNPNKPSDRNTP